MLSEFKGTVRPRITYLGPKPDDPGKYVLKIEWIEGDNMGTVLWQETANVPNGWSYVPQVSAEGLYRPGGGILVEPDNTRHFILNAELVLFTSAGGCSNITKG